MSMTDRCEGCGHFRPCLCVANDGNRVISDGISFGPASDAIRHAQKTVPGLLEGIFERQKRLMELLVQYDKIPEFPIDITSKFGQRHIRLLNGSMVEEMFEAIALLRNHIHRDHERPDVDLPHFKEEIADAFSYFVEILINAGITAQDLAEEHERKNKIVTERVIEGR